MRSKTRAELYPPLAPLSAAEVERGWVEYHCDSHGGLVAMTPGAHVTCRCGKRARDIRHGRLLNPETLKPTRAKARELNSTGHPCIHACGDCKEDFHSKTLFSRHRAGRGPNKRCLTPDEMKTKDWDKDEKGRWRNMRYGSWGSSSGQLGEQVGLQETLEMTSLGYGKGLTLLASMALFSAA